MWKPRRLFALSVGVVFIGLAPTAVSAEDVIRSFESGILIHKDATISVTETIVYDFGDVPAHGIERTIPYRYNLARGSYIADVSDIEARNQLGNMLHVKELREDGMLTVRVGEPNETVTGINTYQLSYKVEGPFLFHDEFDEFYWNVTGDAWEVPMEVVSVEVLIPEGAVATSSACYKGPRGSNVRCARSGFVDRDGRGVYTMVPESLSPREGITIAIAFATGTISGAGLRLSGDGGEGFDYYYLRVAFSILLPLIALFTMLTLWYTRGRDPRGRGTIVPEYEPPKGMGSAVAGLMYDESLGNSELAGELIALAVEGHIRIHRIEKKILGLFPDTDYLFERRTKEHEPVGGIGALILDKLFDSAFEGSHELPDRIVHGALLSKMKHKWTTQKQEVEERVYDEAVSLGYFAHSPATVRLWYVGTGAVLIFAGLPSMAFVGAGVLFAGVIVASIGYFMPAKTALGVAMHEHVEGFRRYLSVAEKDRLEFHHAPEKTPELFDKYLPYAIALKVETQWAEQFEGLSMAECDWYTGSPTHALTATALATDLAHFTSDIAAASAPKSSGSGGGGFSGGGFGGGGGGRW